MRLCVADFAVDHVSICTAIILWWDGRAACSFRLRLSLRVQLLAQGMESLLDFLSQLLDSCSIVTLGSLLQFFNFALNILFLSRMQRETKTV